MLSLEASRRRHITSEVIPVISRTLNLSPYLSPLHDYHIQLIPRLRRDEGLDTGDQLFIARAHREEEEALPLAAGLYE